MNQSKIINKKNFYIIKPIIDMQIRLVLLKVLSSNFSSTRTSKQWVEREIREVRW